MTILTQDTRRISAMSTWVSVSATLAPKLPLSWNAVSGDVIEASVVSGIKLRRPRRTPSRPGKFSTVRHWPANNSSILASSVIASVDFNDSKQFVTVTQYNCHLLSIPHCITSHCKYFIFFSSFSSVFPLPICLSLCHVLVPEIDSSIDNNQK